MAEMIPPDVQEFTTEGEKQVYGFLASFAKPDKRYIVWYTPDINNIEPDFILYSEKAGIVIFEVKDWALEQIESADPNNFYVKIGGRTEPRKNPRKQARDYLNAVIDKIRRDGYLVSVDPMYHGNPSIPLDYGLIFTNINRFEFVERGLDKIVPAGKVFFWDDLNPMSDICMDPSGKCFAAVLEEKFPPKFPFSLTGKQVVHLKQLLFPQVRVEVPERASDFPYEKRQNRLNGLDHHQEAIARRFDRGHHVLTGPSGSGKTLILVHKAAFLRQYNPKIKKILFVCYNVTLVHYVRHLLANKKVPLGKAGVEVMHFFELCSRLLGEDVDYEGQDGDYYEIVTGDALARTKDSGLRYDAVLIDEGQDFSDEMFAVVVALLNKETDNLTIALDDNQNLYGRVRDWERIGVKTGGKVREICCSYRNTVEITRFARRFVGNFSGSRIGVRDDEEGGNFSGSRIGVRDDEGKGRGDERKGRDDEGKGRDDEEGAAYDEFMDFHGPEPEMHGFNDLEAVIGYVTDQVERIVEEDKCPYSEIAILYAKKYPEKEEGEEPLPGRMLGALEARGILGSWLSENYQAKSGYDITTNRVAISTIHSAKGLDYACVFMVGLDCLEPESAAGWSGDQIDRLVYVGLTRARYRLFIPYVGEEGVIGRLKGCLG